MKAEKCYILLELEYVDFSYNQLSETNEPITKRLKLGVFSSEKRAKDFENRYWNTFSSSLDTTIHYIRLPFNP